MQRAIHYAGDGLSMGDGEEQDENKQTLGATPPRDLITLPSPLLFFCFQLPFNQFLQV